MPITLTAVPRGWTRTELDAIPPDVIEAIEEAYTHCQENPGERIQATFTTQDEADEFLAQARSYVYQRPAGRLAVVGNSTKKGQARFRVEAYVAPATDGAAPAAPAAEDTSGQK